MRPTQLRILFPHLFGHLNLFEARNAIENSRVVVLILRLDQWISENLRKLAVFNVQQEVDVVFLFETKLVRVHLKANLPERCARHQVSQLILCYPVYKLLAVESVVGLLQAKDRCILASAIRHV